jgi:hypothetical protein
MIMQYLERTKGLPDKPEDLVLLLIRHLVLAIPADYFQQEQARMDTMWRDLLYLLCECDRICWLWDENDAQHMGGQRLVHSTMVLGQVREPQACVTTYNLSKHNLEEWWHGY